MHQVDDSESHKKTTAIEFTAGRVRESFLEATELFNWNFLREFLVITGFFFSKKLFAIVLEPFDLDKIN